MTLRLPALMLIAMAILGHPAASQQVMPDFQDLSVARGQRVRLDYTLTNAQDIPLNCVLEVSDMAPSLDGFPQPRPGYARGCSNWAEVSADSLVLDPRSVANVTLEIQVPQDAAGGYYAIVEGLFRATDRSLDQLNLADRAPGRRPFFPPTAFRSILLIEVKTRENRVLVVPDSLHVDSGRHGSESITDPGMHGAQGWSVDFVLRNDGTVHSRVAGTAAIWRSNGTLVGKSPFEVGRGYLLPDTRRRFRARGRENLADGLYLAKFDLTVERQGRFQEATPFHVLDGIAVPGEPDSSTIVLLRSLLPRFALREPFRETRVRPGRITSVLSSLVNTQDDSLELRPVPVVWEVDSLGVNHLMTIEEHPGNGPHGWVAEIPESLVLEPRRSGTCRVRLQPPADLQDGEYYFGVLFEDVDGAPTPPSARLNRSQLACLVNGRDLEFDIGLEEFRAGFVGDVLNLRCELDNPGQVRAACRPQVFVRRQDVTGSWTQIGDAVEFPNGDTAFILPGTRRVYGQEVTGLPPGSYQIELSVSFSGQERDPIRRTEYVERSE